jgi:hypothetical protein
MNFLKKAARVLMASANDRAKDVLRNQTEVIKPQREEYRSNAGGWN